MADLGSHQVDVLSWIIGSPPRSVMASGGTDNYPQMQWWDNIATIYEWDRFDNGVRHTVRGSYDVFSTTSHGGYQEVFMGTEGSATISESAKKGGFRREYFAPINEWETEMREQMAIEVEEQLKQDIAAGKIPPKRDDSQAFSECWTPPWRNYPPIPVPMPPKTEHQPHLENFFHAIRGQEKLNCPAEVGFETAVSILKVDQAIKAQRKLTFDPRDYKA